MLERLLRFSVRNRWLVVLFTAAVAAVGVLSLKRLPIDAVPDITNNQVQINTLFPALSPVEIEKQVTFPVETALAGIPGLESTRSLSRNGLSQVTAVFEDGVDIYFARQQVNERLAEAKESLPPGAEPKMGPISTGLGGEAYNVRAAGRIQSEEEIAEIVVGTRNGTPIHVRDVASVGVGRELRTGSASENGHEVVVGTALMLIGANSRTVAAAVDRKMVEVNKSLPADVRAKTVLNRTRLVDATIKTVEKNLFEGAVLVIVVLFLLLGNIRAALVTALAIPLSMLITATGMVQSKMSGNLMSLGAIDFGLIVDGAVIIVENCLRHLAERQHELGRKLNLAERLETVVVSAREMIQPSVYGQAIIITVYIPILALTGIEGKMFRPMAMTVIFAMAGAFVLSLTFVPAMVALLIRGRVREKENFLVRGAKSIYAPAVRAAVRGRWVVVPLAVLLFAVSLWLFSRLGSEFVPTLDERTLPCTRCASPVRD